ncbi:MAG: ankyrin repeat domain-containing protein [Candidatus Latescibacterota bacterium]|jgi:ankyrin repeat protein
MPEEWINVGLLRAAKNGNAKNVGSALTPLIFAATAQVAAVLLDAVAEFDAADDEGNTPLMCAANDDDLEFLDLLLQTGADSQATTKSGRTALMFAATAEIVGALVQAGVDVDATDQAGNSVLHRVAEDGEEAVVRVLLEIGAKANAKNRAGETALTLATTAGHQAVARVLEGG